MVTTIWARSADARSADEILRTDVMDTSSYLLVLSQAPFVDRQVNQAVNGPWGKRPGRFARWLLRAGG